MLPRILILALCCTLLSCKDLVQKYKRSNTGLSSLDRKVLYDFRNPLPASTPTLPDSTLHSVIATIPPACPVAANDAQPTTPHVVSVASGSFTYAAEQETAYLVTGLPCGLHKAVIVMSNGKLQASSDTPYTSIAGTFDLNHDDKNELLLTGETTRDGQYSREASLQTFEKNTLRAVEDLGIVYHDSCSLFVGADDARKKALVASGLTPYVEAVVVYYLPHSGLEMPNFTAERYRAPCPATPGAPPPNWQLVSR